MGMKNITVKTLVDEKFRFLARDLNGSVFVFENEPSIATDIACDTWDVQTGEILQITPPTTDAEVTSDLEGDWRDSLIEIDNEVILN
jgi:hypothetical protein